MKPFAIEFRSNVLYAQAYGTWLYIQLGEYALFCGTHMPWGLRLVWRSTLPTLRFRRHAPTRVASA